MPSLVHSPSGFDWKRKHGTPSELLRGQPAKSTAHIPGNDQFLMSEICRWAAVYYSP
jgi:hypothetical protein